MHQKVMLCMERHATMQSMSFACDREQTGSPEIEIFQQGKSSHKKTVRSSLQRQRSRSKVGNDRTYCMIAEELP